MDLFKSKNQQALITEMNRRAMYNPNRESGVNNINSVGTYDIIKSKGEGSKGGKVIGHTQSGKAIYEQHDHESHKKFNSTDHLDAYIAHGKERDKVAHKIIYEDYNDDKERKELQKKKKVHTEAQDFHANQGYKMTR